MPNAQSAEDIETLLPWNITPDEVNRRYATYLAPQYPLALCTSDVWGASLTYYRTPANQRDLVSIEKSVGRCE